MAGTTLEVLKERIYVIVDEHSEHLSIGRAKDFAEYKMYCGTINGLKLAIREVDELIGHIDVEDQDDVLLS